MEILLVPGLWLDGSSWDQVVPALAAAGHHTHALTLPGMHADDTDRAGVTLADHVDAVVAALDGLDPAAGPAVLVGHSAGGALVHAAADARPDRIARVIHVASEPRADGDAAGEFPIVDGLVPFPEWSFFDEEMVADLDEDLRATMRAQALPSPARVTTDPLHLTGERRYDVPTTVIACEYPVGMLRAWMAQGHPGVRELAAMRDLTLVDLPGGHWPQYSRPDELAGVLLASLAPE